MYQYAIFLIGHSFVRRLGELLGTSVEVTVKEEVKEKFFRTNLGLPMEITCIGNFPDGPPSEDNRVVKMKDVLQLLKESSSIPNDIVLSIGENDVDDPDFSVEDFIGTLKLILCILYNNGVKHVVVCTVLPRERPNRVSPTAYETNRQRVNLALYQIVTQKVHFFREFVYIFRFDTAVTKKAPFKSDGINFTDVGMLGFYHNMKYPVQKLNGIAVLPEDRRPLGRKKKTA